jgi:hypothetical protein
MNALYFDSGMSDEEQRSTSPKSNLDIRAHIAVTKFQEYQFQHQASLQMAAQNQVRAWQMAAMVNRDLFRKRPLFNAPITPFSKPDTFREFGDGCKSEFCC